YVLGYYTTNTNFDGGLRKISVRYKANGKAVRARRRYRARSQAEMAALAATAATAGGQGGGAKGSDASAREPALAVLERAHLPFAAYAAAAVWRPDSVG